MKLSGEEGAALVALARAAIEDKLFGNGALARRRAALVITPPLAAPRACFVTLESAGDSGLSLRGCIGGTEASLPAHEAIVASATDAAFADPRFDPLTREEYPAIVISVSALTPMTAVLQADEIVVGRDGVALECDGRRALFLPEVAAKYGWTRRILLEQLARKAGLPVQAWRRARLFAFESEHFGETSG
jgi:AmmeMemoRadiSam system protein A